ncbi:MAG: septal ring lytic transglycosylase RlpA family protein [Candidatus Limnocylindria bacterium]
MRRALALVLALPLVTSPAEPGAAQTACVSSVGSGIPPPAASAAGIAGYHSQWYGQSGYAQLCANEQATFTIAYRNTGSLGWYEGRMGRSAYLGTWAPDPGQDRPSPLGGDGTSGSPNTGWPRADRIATPTTSYVGPGDVGWFTFMLQAPAEPGWYRLYVRPLVEGSNWMEDEGIHWVVVVKNSDGTLPPEPPPPAPATASVSYASSVWVTASWYGPGFYGNRTACGQTMSTTLQGTAHRTLPCGTPVTLRFNGSTVTIPVVDRGPFIYTREFDLTYATRVRLGCSDLCRLEWLR